VVGEQPPHSGGMCRWSGVKWSGVEASGLHGESELGFGGF
jgi:hypothetical protein